MFIDCIAIVVHYNYNKKVTPKLTPVWKHEMVWTDILLYTSMYVYSFYLGKWNNLFTATLIVTNSGNDNLAITDVEGYYCTGGMCGCIVGVPHCTLYR